MRHAQESPTESSAANELAALQAAAQQWAAHDPDAGTAAQLQSLINDPNGAAELADSFDGNLQFGTAGLRATMGPGPNRMNRMVVRRAAAGVAAHLLALAEQPLETGQHTEMKQSLEAGHPTQEMDSAVASPATNPPEASQTAAVTSPYRPRAVVGFDARYNSRDFAQETAAIFTAAGIETFILPTPLPTPVLAYAVRALECDAGIMVTASHNPAQDNGYKVYLGGRAVVPEARGVQIVAPHDALIATQISHVSDTASFGDTSGIAMAEGGWNVLGEDFVDGYRAAVAGLADPATFPARQLRIVHTSMHGVGDEMARAVFASAGFTDLHTVPEQAAPNPDFPTVSFPNPEEEGAMDMAFALAKEVGADLVIANDPDADRVAVGALDPATGEWHQFHGDQVGALLGSHLVSRGGRLQATQSGAGAPVYANSIVSSRLLAKIAATAGYEHVRTLTGFKWISRVPGLGFGYEEALGYCVAPELVRDKDGISAGLLIAEMAAGLKAVGRTLFDVLDILALAHGLHASTQISIRVEDPAGIKNMMATLREQPPTVLDGSAVIELTDLAQGSADLPATDGLAYLTENDTRVIVRPSGTEPKLKCYLEVVVPVSGHHKLQPAREEAQRALATVVQEIKGALGLADL
ncbi:phospho-sugar mutase [Arthrobacter psychrochitiniphilus]|uniref:phospho-sugar mutase n=1 Tax=Arthrobacter psychrochitiniphilus TaxID=291045 RepID=UPI0017A2286C|nr:phosphomannomutase [Arthrobacter psychrochitiniphilus]